MGMYFVKDWYCQKKKKTYQGIWVDYSWGIGYNTEPYGRAIWTDGDDTYHSYYDDRYTYVLNKSSGNKWLFKGFSGISFQLDSSYIWTDGNNTYCSHGSQNQYVLDKSTSTWNPKTWYLDGNVWDNFTGDYIWRDGNNVYFSAGNNAQYVLDIPTSTWSVKTWNGFTNFRADTDIWTDGDNMYISHGSSEWHWVLDRATSTWIRKNWNITDISGRNVWTDGTNIYHSAGGDYQYVLDKTNSTWSVKDWPGNNRIPYGYDIWTDGNEIYYSQGGNYGRQWILT